jgi:hypothetical protein
LLKIILLSAAVFFIYLAGFCFFIPRIPFFKKSGLSSYWLIGLFLLKIVAGIVYGLFYSTASNIQTSDTWRYFELSKHETDLLLQNPITFIKDLFYYGYDSSGNLFIAHNSYWNNLKDNVLIKILAVVNIFSFKNYNADVIFFNFFFFFGTVAFYRLVKEKIQANTFVLIVFTFCIPSFLFWCSGVHKDGFIFMAIALLIFYFNEYIKRKTLHIKWLPVLIISAALLFALRNFVLLLLLPALVIWYLCERYPQKKAIIILCIYGVCTLLFFIAPYVSGLFNFPYYIVNKQNEFKLLGGNSQLILPQLEPDFFSFLKFLPYAIDTAVLRPHLTERENILYLPSIAESIFIYVLVIYSAFAYSKKQNRFFTASSRAFIIFCFALAFSNLLLMGYTITLTGAIVRYKAFVLPFIIAPLSMFIKKPGKHIV